MEYIRYRNRKYKYQLVEDYSVLTPVIGHHIDQPFFILRDDGTLTIKAGYAWDGPSGPTIDTPTFMRGSLVHDVFYQMMRERLISVDYKLAADELLYRICLEDGMNRIRAHYVFEAVQRFGDSSCEPGSSDDEIRRAP
jgi:hypothetical protein